MLPGVVLSKMTCDPNLFLEGLFNDKANAIARPFHRTYSLMEFSEGAPMKTLLAIGLTVTTLAFALAGAPILAANDGPYLYELLKKPSCRRAWNAMVSGSPGVPTWVKAYARTFDGPSSASKTLALPDGRYLLAWVCKTHDCYDNQLNVVFSPSCRKAWGLLRVPDRPGVWLGAPPGAVQAALSKSAVESRP